LLPFLLQELHLSILQGVQARFETPFFNALVNYSKNPMGVFHAMPISRGASLTHSHWIKDMFNFYGTFARALSPLFPLQLCPRDMVPTCACVRVRVRRCVCCACCV
jgi:hypothetical protein